MILDCKLLNENCSRIGLAGNSCANDISLLHCNVRSELRPGGVIQTRTMNSKGKPTIGEGIKEA